VHLLKYKKILNISKVKCLKSYGNSEIIMRQGIIDREGEELDENADN
jgi:hypothetical protein